MEILTLDEIGVSQRPLSGLVGRSFSSLNVWVRVVTTALAEIYRQFILWGIHISCERASTFLWLYVNSNLYPFNSIFFNKKKKKDEICAVLPMTLYLQTLISIILNEKCNDNFGIPLPLWQISLPIFFFSLFPFFLTFFYIYFSPLNYFFFNHILMSRVYTGDFDTFILIYY